MTPTYYNVNLCTCFFILLRFFVFYYYRCYFYSRIFACAMRFVCVCVCLCLAGCYFIFFDWLKITVIKKYNRNNFTNLMHGFV